MPRRKKRALKKPRRYETFLGKHPETRPWLELGLMPKVALALARAGYLSLADLAGRFREELLALPGFGPGTLALLEKNLGAPLPSRIADLKGRGIPANVEHSLDRAGIRSLEALGRLTREQFLATRGLGETGLRSCEKALGRKLESPVSYLQWQGLRPGAAHLLAVAGVRAVEELARRPDSALRAMGLRESDIADCRRLIREARGERS